MLETFICSHPFITTLILCAVLVFFCYRVTLPLVPEITLTMKQPGDKAEDKNQHKFAIGYYTYEDDKQETHTFTLSNINHRRILLSVLVAVATGTSGLKRITVDFTD